MGEVQVMVTRPQGYAPHVEDYMDVVLPTQTVIVSGGLRRKSIPAGTFVPLASYKVGAGSVLRLTHFGIDAGSSTIWNIRYTGGTIYYQTTAAGNLIIVGEPLAPVHVAPYGGGTYWRVGPFGTYGACTGTIRYTCRFEGIAVQRRVYGSAPTPPS